MKLKLPVKMLNNIIEEKKYTSSKLNKKVLENIGFYLIKNVFDVKLINSYYNYYRKNIGKKFIETPNHKTGVDLPYNNKFKTLIKNNSLKSSINKIFKGNIGCDYIRIIKKDSNFNDKVILHQDTPYQIGGEEKYSLFIPLTTCNLSNGSLQLFPGTHKFGYLGDAGEINLKVLPISLKKCTPDLNQGDILIMNSNLFHQSGYNFDASERIIVEIHILDSREPSSRYLISGLKQDKYQNFLSPEQLFSDSRTQKLKRFYNDKNS